MSEKIQVLWDVALFCWGSSSEQSLCFTCRGKQFKKTKFLSGEYEGIAILQNIRIYSPRDTVLHPKRLDQQCCCQSLLLVIVFIVTVSNWDAAPQIIYCYCIKMGCSTSNYLMLLIKMGCSTSNYLLLLYQNGIQHLKLFTVTVSKLDAAPQTIYCYCIKRGCSTSNYLLLL